MPHYALLASSFWESVCHIGGIPCLADGYSLHTLDKIYVPEQRPLYVGLRYAVFQFAEPLAPPRAHQ